jgi:sialidase-1
LEIVRLQQEELFVSGEGEYHTYRIPALVVTGEDTILAFCEGRRDSSSDSGQIDLLLRRSEDGGQSWGMTQVLVTEPDMTCGNPCPVVDRRTGTLCLLFCKNLAEGHEGLITEGKAPRTVWLTRSQDDGVTWTEPEEITATTKDPSWTWYATGPTHGIQLANGRLVVPCDHMVGVDFDRKTDPYHSHVIISDDGGGSWQIGGIVDEGTNECAVIETANGSLYINCRNYRGEKRRASARSVDGGSSFQPRIWEDDLPEPICQGSLVSLPGDRGGAALSDLALFANPASTEARCDLTLRITEDGGRSWSTLRSLYEGPAAYSDLAVTAEGGVLCLYERGADSPYETLTLAQMTLAQMTLA